jgi:hypothetical protein
MTNEEFESPEEDAGGSAGRQRTTDEILAGLAAKEITAKEVLARLTKVAAAVEAHARRIEEEERGGR